MIRENYKIQSNGKRITCAVIIADSNNAILSGHATGKKYGNECYDLLKGCCDKGEEDIDCAIRELFEESGFSLQTKKDCIIDLGIYKYNREKDIHVFLYRVNRFPNLKKLKCTSYFETPDGKTLPEMNGYRVIRKNERNLFYKGIQFVLNKIKELN